MTDNNVYDLDGNPLVTTDREDYAPGEIVRIKTTGFEAGSTIEFAIADDPNRAGDDGDADTYQRFSVTDGGAGDLDGIVNGQILTNWLVPTDNNGSGSGTPDALNATLNLTATGSDGRVATTRFTDAGGGLDFAAAAPLTYNHQVDGTNPAGGGAFNNGTIGRTADVVESLQGGDFKTGDLVTFLVEIDVNSLGIDPAYFSSGAATIELDFSFLADPNGGSGVGFVDIQNVGLNYGSVENGDGGSGINPGIGVFGTDSGVIDDTGSTATLSNKRFVIPGGNGSEDSSTAFVDQSELRGTVTVTDLEAGEKVILRLDGLLGNDTNPANIDLKGTLQAAILGARVVNPTTGAKEAINVGNQTIPFLSVADIKVPIPTFAISGTKYLDANGDGLTVGDAGLDGVTVYIETDGVAGLTGSEVSTTTTNGGQWSFANLGPSLIGKSVFEVLPSGYTQTLGQAGYALTGTDQADLNFANFKNFAISGTKYLDANGDGLTTGDAGLGGFTIFIDINGNSVNDDNASVVTDAVNGSWSIAGLGIDALGKKVYEVNQDGYVQTLGVGGLTLASTSQNQTGLDFANFKKFDISGTKYLDANGDGQTAGDVGLGGFTIFVDKNGNGLNDDNTSAVTDANGNWSIAGLGIDALGKKVYEVNQSNYVQTLGVGGLTLAGTSQNQTGLNFANFKPSGPGTGTIGYWTNKNGLAAWDSLTPKNLVDDPVTVDPTKVQGILIGDFNRNGVTDNGEKTIFYSVTEARTILNTSTATEGQDARYILDKQLVATWLNVLADNTYDTLFASIKQDIANGVQWIQKATPDENGDGIGDGSLTLAGSTKLPSSDPRWSTTLGVGGNGNSYGSQIKNVLDYYNNTGAGFALDRDTGTIAGSLTTLTSLQSYRPYFG